MFEHESFLSVKVLVLTSVGFILTLSVINKGDLYVRGIKRNSV